MLSLPPATHRGPSLEEVIASRRSIRRFTQRSIDLPRLAQLCHAAQGVTGHAANMDLRATPSAGALYPLELYVASQRVSGLESGIYHYHPAEHALEPRVDGDWGPALSAAGLGQRFIDEAAVNFIFTALPERLRHRYRDRSERYTYMEAGHAAQNLLLQAVAMELGGVAVGAFQTSDMNKLLRVDGARENAVYLIAVGAPG